MTVKSCLIRAILCLSFASNIAAQDRWQWVHPQPQGNALNDIWVFDESNAIAVGGTGTVMITSDGGQTWDIKQYACGTGLFYNAVFFVNRHTGFIVGGYDKNLPAAGICRTDDGGATWVSQEVATDLALLDVHFVSESQGFVVGPGIFLKTTDGGQNWFEPNPLFGRGLSSVFFQNENVGFVGRDLGLILRTTDGGLTWNAVTQGSSPGFVTHKILFLDGLTGFAIGGGGSATILRTSDSGHTWASVDTSWLPKGGRATDIYFTDDSRGFVMTSRGELLETFDRGETWTLRTRIETIGTNQSIAFVDSTSGYAVGGYGPSDPAGGSIHRTYDGGKSWVAQQNRLTGEHLRDVFFLDSDNGSAISREVLLKTTDGGDTWELFDLSFDFAYGLSMTTEETIQVVGGLRSQGVVSRSLNGGQTWETSALDQVGGLRSVFFIDSSNGWVAGEGGYIGRSSDGGSTWEAQETTSTSAFLSIYFLDSNFGMAAGEGGIYRTIDGGWTWTPSTKWGPAGDPAMSVNIIDRNNAIAVGGTTNDSRLMRSEDGGINWFEVEVDGLRLIDVHFGDPTNGIAVGDKGTILRTYDGGMTWAIELGGATSQLKGAYFSDPNTVFVVGFFGLVLRRSESTTGLANNFQVAFAEYSLRNNYPNPFNPSTTIQYSLPHTANVKIVVYDLLGRKVISLVEGVGLAGDRVVVWDGRNANGELMATGLYVVKMTAGSFSASTKALLIR